MRRKASPLAIVGCGAALLSFALPALPALAAPAGSAATVSATTVAGLIDTVANGHQQLTVRTMSGHTETINVPAGRVLVHGIPGTVRNIHSGMTVLAQGHRTSATTFTASAMRVFTPRAATTSMHGIVGTVDQAGRMVVVRIAPYETAVAYLMPGMTVSGAHGTSGMTLLRPGASVTFTGHADSKDASELLASTASVTAPAATAAQ
jgi:hypothetical protein